MITTLLLVLFYPVLLAARVLNRVLGRDPLRLREGPDGTLWIARDRQPDPASYFSEASAVEGRGHRGMGRVALRLLIWLSRAYAPRRGQPAGKFSTAADREQGIPDELYTLW